MKEKYAKKFESLNSPFEVQMLAIQKLNSLMDADLIKDEFYFYKEDYNVVYVYQHEIDKVRKYCLSKLESNPDFFKKLFNDATSLFDDFRNKEIDFVKEIELMNTEDEIKSWLKKFCAYASTITPIGYFVEMFAGYDSYWLNYTGISEDDFTTLISPDQLSFSKIYELEVAKVKLGESNLNIVDLVEKWYWVRNNYYIVDLVNESYIRNQLEKTTTTEAKKTIAETGHFISNLKEKKNEVSERLSLNKETMNILNGLSSFVVLQDERKEIALKTTSLMVRVINKLLEIYNYDENNKHLVLSASLSNWFFELSKEQLLERSLVAFQGVYWPISGDILIGVEAIKKNMELATDNKDDQSTEVKGQVAFRGKITGRVCVVMRDSDFPKFKEGDILVASMTRPEFVPLMKMASAFVTDEGGITCHAAIVARELKKPCIIGTKIATKVLKDGDLVEVDADNGIVKIIK